MRAGPVPEAACRIPATLCSDLGFCVGLGGGGKIKGRNELLECCSDWSSLDAEQTCFGALQWEMSASTFLWDRWWDLLSVALYSLEWGIIYLRSDFPGIQALKVIADPFVISVSLKFMKTVLFFCVVPTRFAINAAFLSCSSILQANFWVDEIS